MSEISASLRASVILRADNRCEYCGLSQAGQEAAFHIDHIHLRAAGGVTQENNLALACVSCSLHKAARQTAIDLETGKETNLYNPRTQKWADNFCWNGSTAIGLTPAGRATIVALKMNRQLIIAIREEEMIRGRHPQTEASP